MVKRKWLWGKKSAEKMSGETDSSGSMSSHSDKISEDQETIKESPSNSQSQVVNSKDIESKINREETNEKEQSLPQILSDASEDVSNDSLSKEDASIIYMTGDTQKLSDVSVEDISNENLSAVSVEDAKEMTFALQATNGYAEDNKSFKLLTEKLSAALVNVSLKEDLVKQHSKVAEEAVAGWEKADKEADILKQQLDTAEQKKSSLEARVSQLDEALKECVRQLRLARDEQERKINQAVAEKTNGLEIAKTKLEEQLVEIQTQVQTSRMTSPDLDLRHRINFLEEENVVLRQELQSLSEELEVRTIERDLSTKAAEAASKQHLESIIKLARLEAECRKLKSLSRVSSLSNDRKSSTAAASCAESLTDSQSDGVEQLSVSECENHKMNGSWASALITELDQFKSEKLGRNTNSSSKDINLMDDFLEMERLAALPDSGHQFQSVSCDKIPETSAHEADVSSRIELESMARQNAELEEHICKMEAEKAEFAMALAQAQSCFEESQVQLIETQMKLEQLEGALHGANEGEQFYKALFMQFEREANLMSSQIKSLHADIEREQALSEQISTRCKDLEKELMQKEEELDMQQDALSSNELKMKQITLSQTQDSLEKSEAQLRQAEMKFRELEKELQDANEEKKLLNSELDSLRVELQRMSSQVESLNKQVQKDLLNEQLEKELQEANDEKKSLKSELDSVRTELQEANEEKKALNSELDSVRVKLQSLSSQIELLNEQAQKEILNESLEKELQEAKNKKKSLNSELDSVRVQLNEANDEKKFLKFELDNIRSELRTMSSQIEPLNEQLQKEHALVVELSRKSEEMEYKLLQKTQELEVQQNLQRAHSNNELKIKQEDLAIAAGKLADCQQTIASLGSQLKSLATLEDFLIDTASIPGFSPPAPLMARSSIAEPWKLHANDTYLTEKEFDPLRDVQEDLSPFAIHNRGRDIRGSPASSSSSTSSAFFSNYPGPKKSGNGFANFYSLSRS